MLYLIPRKYSSQVKWKGAEKEFVPCLGLFVDLLYKADTVMYRKNICMMLDIDQLRLNTPGYSYFRASGVSSMVVNVCQEHSVPMWLFSLSF